MVDIKLSELKEKVEKEYFSKKEIAEYFNIPENQVTKLLNFANLKIQRKPKISFNLIDDTVDVSQTTVDASEFVLRAAENIVSN